MGRPFKPRNTVRAKKLRNQATPAERELWKYISKRQLAGLKFSRQIPIGLYICDFVCRELKFVVELDGFSHESQQLQDRARTKFLEAKGYSILRFRNEDVFKNVEGVLIEIEKAIGQLDRPTPGPSRLREGR